MNTKYVREAIMIALILTGAVATASVPPMINYQGKLMQSNGTPVPDGEYKIAFAIYGQPTGGTALWSEVNEHVQIRGGLYSVLLGSVINLPANIFDASDRFFGVKVGDDPEMTPRQQIASVGFAVKAASADIASTVPDGAITSAKLAEGTVIPGKILDQAITTPKIADGAVTPEKIADGSILARHVQPIEAWVVPVLLNGWENYGASAGYNTAAYCRDAYGIVRLKGLVVNSSQAESAVFVLPPGYRPSRTYLFPAAVGPSNPLLSAALGRVDIRNDGTVFAQSGFTQWVSLDGLTFRGEQ